MKMKVNAKKIIILVSMVLLLVATGCLNYFLGQKTNSPIDNNEPVITLNFFDAYRQDREELRSKEIVGLNDIIASEVTSTDAAKSAESKRLELVVLIEKEFVLEGLIKARGFDDCIVTISSASINVVVKADVIDETSATQIIALMVKETGVKYKDVIVIPYV